MTTRPRLTPAMADVRRAVREALDAALPGAKQSARRDPSCGAPGGWVIPDDAPLVLVALSGGPIRWRSPWPWVLSRASAACVRAR
jgi:tRNA(Ile)-lysidine synthase